ncbi:unnamed protein product [Oppiella nova]|uniref:Peroxisomal membrane protein PEX14 n=1 Tax=Oppiella nova TaxID=334625 RepID=A0A7R9LLA1_9ACAR|nr:unnamed protein product [Oppiella nova]CAG2164766.1 unnamed protein product [Oppiella nova]
MAVSAIQTLPSLTQSPNSSHHPIHATDAAFPPDTITPMPTKSALKTNNESNDGNEGNAITADETIQTQSPSKPSVPINREVIREDMVNTAVNFLLNERVADSPLHQKRTFLLRKGLSLEEIDAAIDRSTRVRPLETHKPIAGNNTHAMINGPQIQPLMPSFLVRSTQLMSSVALFGGFLYGAYVLYKRFIEPMIFERQRKPHPYVAIQQQLDQLSKAMTLLQTNVSSIETNIKRQIESELRLMKAPEDVTLHELKTELASIKALLVNRRQFAATPQAGIPLWQMNDQKTDKMSDELPQHMNGSVDDSTSNSSSDDNNSHNVNNCSVESTCGTCGTTEVVTNGLHE